MVYSTVNLLLRVSREEWFGINLLLRPRKTWFNINLLLRPTE